MRFWYVCISCMGSLISVQWMKRYSFCLTDVCCICSSRALANNACIDSQIPARMFDYSFFFLLWHLFPPSSVSLDLLVISPSAFDFSISPALEWYSSHMSHPLTYCHIELNRHKFGELAVSSHNSLALIDISSRSDHPGRIKEAYRIKGWQTHKCRLIAAHTHTHTRCEQIKNLRRLQKSALTDVCDWANKRWRRIGRRGRRWWRRCHVSRCRTPSFPGVCNLCHPATPLFVCNCVTGTGCFCVSTISHSTAANGMKKIQTKKMLTVWWCITAAVVAHELNAFFVGSTEKRSDLVSLVHAQANRLRMNEWILRELHVPHIASFVVRQIFIHNVVNGQMIVDRDGAGCILHKTR